MLRHNFISLIPVLVWLMRCFFGKRGGVIVGGEPPRSYKISRVEKHFKKMLLFYKNIVLMHKDRKPEKAV